MFVIKAINNLNTWKNSLTLNGRFSSLKEMLSEKLLENPSTGNLHFRVKVFQQAFSD